MVTLKDSSQTAQETGETYPLPKRPCDGRAGCASYCSCGVPDGWNEKRAWQSILPDPRG